MNTIYDLSLLPVILNLFEGNTNVTTDSGMSDEMKTYYSDYLLDIAKPLLTHDIAAQKHPIPKNGGKTIEFRKASPLPKMLTALTEGVTPNGQKLTWSKISATVAQYGGYVELSDMLLLTAIDNNLVMATELIGDQAGRTLDTISREVLVGGTNVVYSGGKNARNLLTAADKLTVKDIRTAVRVLKKMNAKPLDGGYFVAIINPDVSFDLMSDPEWQAPHQYVDTSNIYEGEIGRIAGVRFIETTEAKIWKDAGASSQNVYATLVLGKNAYGTTEVAGGGLQHIVKQLGSAGTADPLNQRATVGWKATKVTKRLVEEYMVRIESGCTFDDNDGN